MFNKTFHVIAISIGILQTRHLERSVTESKDLTIIICLQIIISPVKDLYKNIIVF